MCFDAKLYLEKDKCNAWVINLFLGNKIFKKCAHLTSFLANRKWNQTTVAVLDCTQWDSADTIIKLATNEMQSRMDRKSNIIMLNVNEQEGNIKEDIATKER